MQFGNSLFTNKSLVNLWNFSTQIIPSSQLRFACSQINSTQASSSFARNLIYLYKIRYIEHITNKNKLIVHLRWTCVFARFFMWLNSKRSIATTWQTDRQLKPDKKCVYDCQKRNGRIIFLSFHLPFSLSLFVCLHLYDLKTNAISNQVQFLNSIMSQWIYYLKINDE